MKLASNIHNLSIPFPSKVLYQCSVVCSNLPSGFVFSNLPLSRNLPSKSQQRPVYFRFLRSKNPSNTLSQMSKPLSKSWFQSKFWFQPPSICRNDDDKSIRNSSTYFFLFPRSKIHQKYFLIYRLNVEFNNLQFTEIGCDNFIRNPYFLQPSSLRALLDLEIYQMYFPKPAIFCLKTSKQPERVI